MWILGALNLSGLAKDCMLCGYYAGHSNSTGLVETQQSVNRGQNDDPRANIKLEDSTKYEQHLSSALYLNSPLYLANRWSAL